MIDPLGQPVGKDDARPAWAARYRLPTQNEIEYVQRLGVLVVGTAVVVYVLVRTMANPSFLPRLLGAAARKKAGA